MSLFVQASIAIAAAVFIAVSAVMNAVFLSSLGQTAMEASLLTAVSIAADIAKAILPVLVVRAIAVRAWWHCATATVMLALLVTMSLTSGTGFAALTRNAVTAIRQSHAERIDALRQRLQEIEASLTALPTARQLAVVTSEIEARKIEWAWTSTKGCTDITSAAGRRFCTALSALRNEAVVAEARDRLTAERSGTRVQLERLREAGAGGDHDPQATAVAALLKVDPALLRVVLPVWIAVVLELGAVALVLLWAGPTVRLWQEPNGYTALEEKTEVPVIQPPPPRPPDPVGWQLQRSRIKLEGGRDGSHAR